jgi:hypothetical protein
MSTRLDSLLREYILDTISFHEMYHDGEFGDCDRTECYLARELVGGRVSPSVYQAIIDGRESVGQ